MATSYSITIQMNQATVEDLAKGNDCLLGFKAVLSSAPNDGKPVVWFSSNTFGLNTLVRWTESYQAYTGDVQDIAQGQIYAANPYPIDLGQRLVVNGGAGTGTVMNDGVRNWAQISNEVSEEFSCGLSMQSGKSYAPICAFPLNGHHTVSIQPIEKVLLVFSAGPVNTGQVIEQSNSDGLLLTFTDTTNLMVQYDNDKGWEWGGQAWGQVIPSGNIAKALIQAGSPSSQ